MSEDKSFFGRPEPKGRRRLGGDLALLGKWITAVSKVTVQGYPLSQFSSADQEKLLKQPPCVFRLERDADNNPKLTTVPVGEERPIDPEVAQMLYNPNYQRCQARHHQLMCGIEDASPAGDIIAAAEMKAAKLAGLDDKTAEARAKHAFNHHIDEAGRAITRGWKQEKLERRKKLGMESASPNARESRCTEPASPDAKESLYSLGSIGDGRFNGVSLKADVQASLSPVGHGRFSAQDLRTAIEEDFKRHFTIDNNTKIPTRVPQFTPETKLGAQFVGTGPSPTSISPAHGSETTANSSSSSSPKSLGSDSSSDSSHSASGSIGTVTGLSIHINGGASLDPFTSGTPRYQAGKYQGVDGHLGAGLKQVLLQTSMSANPIPLTDGMNNGYLSAHAFVAQKGGYLADSTFQANQVASHVAYAGESLASPSTSQFPCGSFTDVTSVFESQSEAETLFTTQKLMSRVIDFRISAVQPCNGITCYDAPLFQAGGYDTLVPEYWTTTTDKIRYTAYKTSDLRAEDLRLRTDPEAGAAACNPIHIFVDLSNIIIGFYDSLKMKRGIPVQKRVSPPPFSFGNLNIIITRGRQTAKKVVAGSIGNSNKRRPDYMYQAEKLGYEMNILQRVPKPVSPAFRRKSKNVPREFESATSGPDTSGDDYFVGPMKNGEQGVDELLHLKILQSTIDTPGRGTIALATGDAAHAEYSDGFKKNIERALGQGWNIELYGWSRNISSAWRDPAFTSKWGRKFRIIELDAFCEELFDITIESMQRK